MHARFSITLLGLALGTCFVAAQPDYGNDNVRYATMGWRDLPKALRDHPDALLLDVRSPGEFNDTSYRSGLNIGRLRGAVNIPIDSIAEEYQRLLPYRNRPIFVYCSHSQRSRSVCTQLADSGFTGLINVNGGLSRYRSDHSTLTELDSLVESRQDITFIDPRELCAFAAEGAYMLDVRAGAMYDPAQASEHVRAMGRVRQAVHIPRERLREHLSELPRDRAIVILDAFGDEGYAAATELAVLGFDRVYVLFDGLDDLLFTPPGEFPCAHELVDRSLPYHLITAEALDPAMVANGSYRVVDVRTPEEFEMRAKMPWQNIGRVRGALNIPVATLLDGETVLDLPRDAHVLVVGRGNTDEMYAATRSLCERGYGDVTMLVGGIWHLRWSAHNVAGLGALETIVEVPKGAHGP